MQETSRKIEITLKLFLPSRPKTMKFSSIFMATTFDLLNRSRELRAVFPQSQTPGGVRLMLPVIPWTFSSFTIPKLTKPMPFGPNELSLSSAIQRSTELPVVEHHRPNIDIEAAYPLAEFDRIVTHADGAVGIQISQQIGRLVVRRGIETFGGTGESLVKGVVMKLSATGLSIKTGGSAREIEIDGGIITNGTGIAPIELNGAIQSLQVNDGLAAAGVGFDKT